MPRPAGGELVPWEKITLANGLTVAVHTDRKSPIVTANAWYDVGSKNEPPGRTGLAHLFEHPMFQGSKHYDDEYFKPFEQVGATSVNGTTGFGRPNYFQNVPARCRSVRWPTLTPRRSTTCAKAEKYFGPVGRGPAITRPGIWIAAVTDSRRVAMYDQVAQPRWQRCWKKSPDNTRDSECLGLVGDLANIEAPIRKLGLGRVQVLEADGNVLR